MSGGETCLTGCTGESCLGCSYYSLVREVGGEPLTDWETRYEQLLQLARETGQEAMIPIVHERMRKAGVFSENPKDSYSIELPNGHQANPQGAKGQMLYFTHFMDAHDYNSVLGIGGQVVEL